MATLELNALPSVRIAVQRTASPTIIRPSLSGFSEWAPPNTLGVDLPPIHSQAVIDAKITVHNIASVPRSRTLPLLRLVRVATPITISDANQPQIKIRQNEKRFTDAPVTGSNDTGDFSDSWR